jgi:hypothetical protein
MRTFLRYLGRCLATYLSQTVPGSTTALPTDKADLLRCLQPGDVLLVESRTRMATAIKYLTQSMWSHAALYVGNSLGGEQAPGEPYLFIEADVLDGVCKRPLSAYENLPTRICRPKNLRPEDLAYLLGSAQSRLGYRYDLKNVWDLARYLLPQPPVPARWRRPLIALGSGDPTLAICSSLIAQAFGEIGYPILPVVTQALVRTGRHRRGIRELFHIRHHSLYVPRDFDVSPYFEIIKPSLHKAFDYRQLRWDAGALAQ